MASRHNDPFDDFEDEDDGYLTFDAREEQEGGNRTWLIVAGAVLLVLVVGIVGWNLFAGGGAADDEAPVIASTDGDFKSAADGTADGTGMLVPGDGAGVLEGTDAAPPLSVEPLTGAEDPVLAGASAGTPGAAPPIPPASPAASAPKAAPPAAKAPPPPPAVRPASPPPAAKADAPARPATQVAQASPPATRPASPPPAARPASSPPAAARPASPPASPPRSAAPAASPPASAAASPAASGGPAAQLGSFRSRAQAETALAGMRDQGLSGATVGVVEADLGERGIWYRVRATGFSSRSSAEEFCVQARSRGINCIVASR